MPQVGWACGPAPMIAALAKAHSFLTFTVPANNQLAVAHGLDHEKDFYECARFGDDCTQVLGRAWHP